jgi:hypothetical protein
MTDERMSWKLISGTDVYKKKKERGKQMEDERCQVSMMYERRMCD